MLRPLLILILKPADQGAACGAPTRTNKGMVTIYGSAGMVRLTFFGSHDKIKVGLS